MEGCVLGRKDINDKKRGGERGVSSITPFLASFFFPLISLPHPPPSPNVLDALDC